MESQNQKTTTIILAFATAFFLFWSTACGPAALEAKRMPDQCNATYGFNTAKSISCMDTGYGTLAMASNSETKDL